SGGSSVGLIIGGLVVVCGVLAAVVFVLLKKKPGAPVAVKKAEQTAPKPEVAAQPQTPVQQSVPQAAPVQATPPAQPAVQPGQRPAPPAKPASRTSEAAPNTPAGMKAPSKPKKRF
ncbi:MAG: hypothetical protein ACPGES_06720, partial [Coraliomargarita sp.]